MLTQPAQGDQLQKFLDNTQEVAPPPHTDPDGGQAARVPFPTAYVLTGEQEQDLIAYAMRRLREMEQESGRGETGETNWFESLVAGAKEWGTHFGKRFIYDQVYHNKLGWRKYCLGGIFAKSNLVVPITRDIVRKMVARANSYFFSTDPWFAAYPFGQVAHDIAEKLGRWTQYKFSRNRMKRTLENANELAFVRGETVVKTTFETKEQIFKKIASVLVDDKDKDILDANKDYILESDIWVRGMTVSVQDPATGLMTPSVPTGGYVLKKDLTTQKPAKLKFVTKTITQRRMMFQGSKSEIVYYRDFLCPLTAPSVQDADCIVHLYDKDVMDIVDTYNRQGLLNKTAPEESDAIKRFIELIRGASTDSGAAKSAKDQPRPELGETTVGRTETLSPKTQIAEFHMRYDADGDGIMEDIVLILDKVRQFPIMYDYESNVTPDGERPFDVIRVIEVDGRWYGIGALELFESSQEIIDLLVNRWNFSQSDAGRVTFWNGDNTAEGQSDKNLKFNWGKTYRLINGKTKEETLGYISLPDVKHDALKDMFEFFMQLVTNASGVANANDAQTAGLDSSELATGVRNIAKSGEEQFSVFLSPLEEGDTSVIRRNMQLDLDHLNKNEVFVFFEGDQQATDTLEQEDAQGVVLDCELLLTRYRNEQQLQSSQVAAQLIYQFYTYPPQIQPKVAEQYRTMLKALGCDDADKTIVPGSVQLPPAAPGQAAPPPGPQQGSGAPAMPPPPQPTINTAAMTAAISATPSGQAPPSL